VVTRPNERGIGFRSLTEQLPLAHRADRYDDLGGKLIFHVLGALAEFERDIIRERTQAGLASARARGAEGGGPKTLETPAKVAMARTLCADHSHSTAEICASGGVSRATLSCHLDTPLPSDAQSVDGCVRAVPIPSQDGRGLSVATAASGSAKRRIG
jgi:DNA invertase Pin-like site-specific DNA recombinase